jgi:hypothetical protein
MAFHDAAVAEELGLAFEECYPEKEPASPLAKVFSEYVAEDASFGWPTYVLVERTEYSIHPLARYQGGVPKAKFREVVRHLIGEP